MNSITLNKETFIQKFLSPIAAISEKSTIKISNGIAECICYVPDNKQTLILYATVAGLNIVDEQGQPVNDVRLDISNTKKFVAFLNTINSENIILAQNGNYLEYVSAELSFKYYLMAQNIAQKEIINKDKINSMNYDFSFVLTNEKIKEILKYAGIIATGISSTDSAKIYLFTKDLKMYGELNDRTIPNQDNATMSIADTYVGEGLSSPLPLHLDIFKLISSLRHDNISVSINKELGVVQFEVNSNGYNIKYITSARVK